MNPGKQILHCMATLAVGAAPNPPNRCTKCLVAAIHESSPDQQSVHFLYRALPSQVHSQSRLVGSVL